MKNINNIFEDLFKDDVDLIKREWNLLLAEKQKMFVSSNKIYLKRQKIETLLKEHIKNISQEILARDFSNEERLLLQMVGIDRKFKELSLLESLLRRSGVTNFSRFVRDMPDDSHVRLSRRRLKKSIQDPYDDTQVKEFFRGLNVIVDDSFRFRIRKYTEERDTDFGIDIVAIDSLKAFT